MQINNRINQNIGFGMKADAKMAQMALKDIEPSLRECIETGVNSFCKTTARKGIDGNVRIKRVITNTDGDFLEYSLRPSTTGKKLNNQIELANITRKGNVLTLADSIKTQMLEGISHLMK